MKFPTDPQKRNNWIALMVILSVPTIGCLGIAGACLLPPNPERWVDRRIVEVESSAKEMGLRGTVLFMSSSDAVDAVDLATGSKKTVFTCRDGFTIDDIDGPNKHGLAIVTEFNFGSHMHRFSVLNMVSGKAELLFQRRGHEFWSGTVGSSPALAEDKNVVVYFDGDQETQLHDPEAFMITGKLVMLDLDKKTKLEIASPAFEDPLAISKDGSTVFFRRALDRDEAKKLVQGESVAWGSGPVAVLFEWRGGSSRPVAAGGHPLVLERPDSISFYDLEGKSFVWNPKTNTVMEFSTPSYISEVGELLPDDTLLGIAPQIDPSKVVFVGDNFSRGVHGLPRIVAINPGKKQIHTIVQAFDSEFDKWSYGEWSATK